MSSIDNLAKDLVKIMHKTDEKGPKPYEPIATVVKEDENNGDILWVKIPGSNSDTPVEKTINANPGDSVRVRVSGGRAWVVGNASSPPTDDARANQVGAAAQPSIDFVAALADKDVTVKSITAATGYIDDLYSKNITTEDLKAAHAYIDDLEAKNITTDNIEAATGYIGDLESKHITVDDIEADHATINTLDANYANIHLANVDVAWIEQGNIKKAEVFDENVFDLSGNRATLSRIDASKINVANLNADNLIVRRINGQPVVGGYTLIDSNSPGYESKNPQALGWYEFVNAQWVLSTDTTVDMTKAYYQEGNEVSLYDQQYIDGLESDLQQQIDGAVQTYTGAVVPTLTNWPYTDWYDTSVTPIHDERAKHVGDIYYVVNSSSDEGGYCYRFAYDNAQHAYSWVLIKDSDVTKALSDISELQTFESETTSWIDETDQGLETIRTNHTALSGRVDDVEATANAALPASTFETFESTTFTDLVDEVDEQSTTMTNMTTRLGLNSDGSGSSTDIVAKESALEQTVEGISTRVGKTEMHLAGMYATSSTAAGTVEKGASIVPFLSNYELVKGAIVTVKFVNKNTSAAPTLNLNNTGAKAIKTYAYGNLTPTEAYWKAGSTFTFTYNGTYWLMHDSTASVRMNTAETSITQTADSIESLASNTSTYTKPDGTIGTNAIASAISQNANDISLKVSKNDVINQINVSTEGAQISASKVDIAGAAIFNNYSTTQQMNSAIGNAVDGIEVGGRNYAITSLGHIEIGTTETRQSGVTATLIGPATIKLNGTATSNDWFFSSSAVFCGIALEAGTYACWATTPNVSLRVGKGSDSAYFGSLTLGSKDNPYLFTIETSDIYWFTPNCAAGKSFSNQLVKIMIEKGNKATDWTPAPEDVQAEIDAKKSTHTLTASNTGGTTYATILGWAQEGTSVTFGVTSTAGVKIGDTVRIAYKAVDMGTGGTIVYILGTVTGVNNATSLTTISHGLDTTVIDGGHILTGTIDANKVNVSNLTVGSFGSEGLKTGGKNLLSGTLIMLNGEGTYASHTFRASGGTLSSTWFASADMPAPGLYRVLRTTNSTSSTAQCGFAQDGVPINIKSGTYVTISAWVRASVDNVTFKFQPFWYNNAYPCSNVGPATLTISRAWKHCTLTVKTTTNITPECSAGYCYATLPAGAFFDVTGLKLEVGSVATEFTDDTEFDEANLCAPGSDLEFNIDNFAKAGFTAGGIAQGKRCSYLNGELGVTKYLYNGIDLIPQPNEFFTISCEMLLSNYTAGTTNPYVTLYFSGSSNNSSGAWASASVLITTVDGIQKHLANAGEFPAQDLNGKGWVKVVSIGRYANVTFNEAFNIAAIFARDFTGKLCIRNFKVERGYKASPWTPNGDSRVATNYIYASSSGLRIASANPATQNQRIVLTSSQMSMYDSGNIERLRLNSSTGVLVGRQTAGHTIVNDTGLDVYASDGTTVSGYFHGDTSRIGRGDRGRVDIASTGIDMYGYNANANTANQLLCHIGFASGNATSGQNYAPYYTFGTRYGSSIGNYSFAAGENCEATAANSQTFGANTKTTKPYQMAIGQWNAENADALFMIGYGSSVARKNVFEVNFSGKVHIINDVTIKNGSAIRLNDGAGSEYSWNQIYSGTYSGTNNLYVQADGYIGFYVGNASTAPTGRMYVNYEGTSVGGFLHAGDYIRLGTNNKPIYARDTSNTDIDIMRFDTGNDLVIGYGSYSKNTSGYDTWLEGYNVYLRARQKCYSNGSQISTSDRRLKKDILPISDKFRTLFMDLKPVEYKLRDSEDKDIHLGLIAQDVESSFDKSDITADDYALVDEYRFPEEEVSYKALAYTEFIPLCIKMIQSQQKEIDELKGVIKCIS